MLAPHGWKSRLTPRRGFTVVQAVQETQPPVVVALHDSAQSLHLFQAALDEAMSRSIGLVVLDFGPVSLHDQLTESGDVSPGEHRLKAMMVNSHVHVIRTETFDSGLESTLSFCESHEATLLIVSADFLADAAADPSLRSRVFSERFDLLVVTDKDEASSVA